MACEDGTLYIFLPSHKLPDLHAHHPEPMNLSGAHSRLGRQSDLSSGSASPSSSSFVLHQAPFHVSPRSRVVSGVTAEQVEASKNFVDFDDEPDKLMEMLRGKSPRDKAFADAPPVSFDKGLAPYSYAPDPTTPVLKRRDNPKSLLSATNSPASTLPRSQVTPGTPKVVPVASFSPCNLSLRCHVIPPYSGPGSPIVGMQILDHTRLLVALQATGWVLGLLRVPLP
jgi:hypothetical protein